MHGLNSFLLALAVLFLAPPSPRRTYSAPPQGAICLPRWHPGMPELCLPAVKLADVAMPELKLPAMESVVANLKHVATKVKRLGGIVAESSVGRLVRRVLNFFTSAVSSPIRLITWRHRKALAPTPAPRHDVPLSPARRHAVLPPTPCRPSALYAPRTSVAALTMLATLPSAALERQSREPLPLSYFSQAVLVGDEDDEKEDAGRSTVATREEAPPTTATTPTDQHDHVIVASTATQPSAAVTPASECLIAVLEAVLDNDVVPQLSTDGGNDSSSSSGILAKALVDEQQHDDQLAGAHATTATSMIFIDSYSTEITDATEGLLVAAAPAGVEEGAAAASLVAMAAAPYVSVPHDQLVVVIEDEEDGDVASGTIPAHTSSQQPGPEALVELVNDENVVVGGDDVASMDGSSSAEHGPSSSTTSMEAVGDELHLHDDATLSGPLSFIGDGTDATLLSDATNPTEVAMEQRDVPPLPAAPAPIAEEAAAVSFAESMAAMAAASYTSVPHDLLVVEIEDEDDIAWPARATRHVHFQNDSAPAVSSQRPTAALIELVVVEEDEEVPRGQDPAVISDEASDSTVHNVTAASPSGEVVVDEPVSDHPAALVVPAFEDARPVVTLNSDDGDNIQSGRGLALLLLPAADEHAAAHGEATAVMQEETAAEQSLPDTAATPATSEEEERGHAYLPAEADRGQGGADGPNIQVVLAMVILLDGLPVVVQPLAAAAASSFSSPESTSFFISAAPTPITDPELKAAVTSLIEQQQVMEPAGPSTSVEPPSPEAMLPSVTPEPSPSSSVKVETATASATDAPLLHPPALPVEPASSSSSPPPHGAVQSSSTDDTSSTLATGPYTNALPTDTHGPADMLAPLQAPSETAPLGQQPPSSSSDASDPGTSEQPPSMTSSSSEPAADTVPALAASSLEQPQGQRPKGSAGRWAFYRWVAVALAVILLAPFILRLANKVDDHFYGTLASRREARLKRLHEDGQRRRQNWPAQYERDRAWYQPGPEATTAAAGPRLSREDVEVLAEPREAGVGDGRTDVPEELQADSEPAFFQQQHGAVLVPPIMTKDEACCDEGNSSTHHAAVTGAGENIAFPASPSSVSRVHACV